MGKQFNNGVWSAVQFIVCTHDETELAEQLVKESGLTRQDCLKSQKESEFESEIMLKFINDIYPADEEEYCIQCMHCDISPNCAMYCRVLQKKITVRKKPCKHYKIK